MVKTFCFPFAFSAFLANNKALCFRFLKWIIIKTTNTILILHWL